jgi:hypothetical protein
MIALGTAKSLPTSSRPVAAELGVASTSVAEFCQPAQ